VEKTSESEIFNYFDKNLKYWLTETYDYNKIYNSENSPISVLLNPYFKKISNLYIFYVVSNNDEDKCDKQIDLIHDSKKFLDEINKYLVKFD
jgi:hypothetical protein